METYHGNERKHCVHSGKNFQLQHIFIIRDLLKMWYNNQEKKEKKIEI